MFSAWLIFLAMVFDALDGYIARLAKSASEFGAELDSLCDMVSFGVAPAFLLVKMCPQFSFFHKEAVWVIAASYAVVQRCGWRVQRGDQRRGRPHDLSRPAQSSGGGEHCRVRHHVLYAPHASDNPLFSPGDRYGLQFVLPFFALLAAMLMVSRIPYPHVVNQVFRGQRTLRHLVGIIFTLVAMMVFRDYAVSIVS